MKCLITILLLFPGNLYYRNSKTASRMSRAIPGLYIKLLTHSLQDVKLSSNKLKTVPPAGSLFYRPQRHLAVYLHTSIMSDLWPLEHLTNLCNHNLPPARPLCSLDYIVISLTCITFYIFLKVKGVCVKSLNTVFNFQYFILLLIYYFIKFIRKLWSPKLKLSTELTMATSLVE